MSLLHFFCLCECLFVCQRGCVYRVACEFVLLCCCVRVCAIAWLRVCVRVCLYMRLYPHRANYAHCRLRLQSRRSPFAVQRLRNRASHEQWKKQEFLNRNLRQAAVPKAAPNLDTR